MRSPKNPHAQGKAEGNSHTEANNMNDARTEDALYFAQDFTERKERAAQANVVANQAEAVKRTWQAETLTATAQSADPATLGIEDHEAERAAAQASANLGALTQSASVLADSVRAISNEWVDLVRHSTERSTNHVAAMMRCRSPSDFIHAQADAFRDNMEMLIDSSRRIAEITLRTADETSYVVGRNLKPLNRAE
jgi:hypothetical protein